MARFEPLELADRGTWREWLAKNHEKSGGVWLIFYKKHTGKATLTYEEAVEEALAFGWIDGQTRALDDKRYQQRFSPRRPGSTWAKSNKQRVKKLIREGRMTPAGLALVEAAQKDGSWDRLTDVDDLVVPDELKTAFSANPAANKHFGEYSDSLKRQILWWLASAKRPQTRRKRLDHIVEAAENGQRPF